MPRIVRATLLAYLLLLASATVSTATGVSYLDEAVQRLQTDNVYISPLAGSIGVDQQQLEDQAGANNIAIAILPAQAADETGGDTSQFLVDLEGRTTYDTIVVAFGNDFVAGSHSLESGVAQQLADQAESGSGPLGERLLGFIAEVGTSESGSTPSLPDPPSGDVGAIAGIGGAVVFLLGVSFFVMRARMRSRTTKQELPRLAIQGDLRPLLEQTRQSSLLIRNDPELQEVLLTAATETAELFAEIQSNLPGQIQEKTAVYVNHVQRANRVLELYLKAQDRPRRFNDAEQVKAKARSALVQFGENVNQNLISIGESELIDFEVDVRMLDRSTTRPQIEL